MSLRLLTQARRYGETIRHLRPAQVFWRLAYAAVPRRIQPINEALFRSPSGTWMQPAEREPVLVAATQAQVFGTRLSLSNPADWQPSNVPKLLIYNLHYFDDLCAANASERRDWQAHLIERWVEENPPGRGTGWEPYPTSLRIVNWCKWHLRFARLTPRSLASLATQARWLAARPEYHLYGNHLFVNAKALIFAGACLDTAEAPRWLRQGLAILEVEVDEQVLADGGHFELSPMYHSLILEDLLDLIQLGRVYPDCLALAQRAPAWLARVRTMLDWLQCLCHPDGEIAFFNDAATGIAPTPSQLAGYASYLGIPRPGEKASSHLPASGYARLCRGGYTAIIDLAKVGPDYLPGHAHADTLAFELSYGGQRIICNSGTSTYDPGPVREWERSTPAHNTVAVDGMDSSETWKSFRVGRRAKPQHVQVDLNAAMASAAHDGYRYLRGRPQHGRSLSLEGDGVVWEDRITGEFEHVARGTVPLHPAVHASQFSNDVVELSCPDGTRFKLQGLDQLPLSIEPGWFAPRFGERIPRQVITWQLAGTLPLTARIRLTRQH